MRPLCGKMCIRDRVYVACADKDGVTVERLQLGGDRARVRRLATLKALDMVRRAARCV